MQAHLLNALVNSSIDAIVCGNSAGHITLFNPAAERLFGYTQEEALGQSFTLLAREQDRTAQLVLFKRFLRTGKRRTLGARSEAMAQHRDGSQFPVLMTLAADTVDGEHLFTAIMHDISERKQANAKLRQYRNIVASTSDIMALLNRELVYQTVNPAFLEFVNKTAAEVEGSTPAQILGHEVFEKVVKPRAERCLAGEFVDFEHKLDFPGAGSRWMRIHYYPHRNGNGVVDGMVMNARDITDRRNTEEALIHQQTQLHALLEAGRQLNHTLDQNRIRKTLVTAACTLLGCDSGAAGIAKEGCMVFHEYLKASQWIPLDYRFKPGFGVPGHVLQTGKPYISDDAEHDTHVVPAIRQALDFHRLVDVPILSHSGKVLGCFEIHDRRDGQPFQESDVKLLQGLAASAAVALENTRLLEEQKLLVNTLQEKESQVRSLLECANDAILLVDLPRQRIIDANPQACHLLEYSIDELLTLPLSACHPPNMRQLEQFIHQLVADGSGWTDQIDCCTKTNRIVPTEISASIVQYEGITCMLAIVHDISERKAHEQQLRLSLEGTIQAISLAVEARDPYTVGHERRVASLALAIGHKLSLDREQREGVRLGALIHDIGKIQLPAEILSKPTRLTKLEYSLIQCHPEVGYQILKDIAFPWPLAKIVHQHHERLDGSGYPQGLKGKAICLEAKIVAVADVVEAMASHRPYRPAVGIGPALEEIRRGRGQLYDCATVDASLALFADQLFQFE